MNCRKCRKPARLTLTEPMLGGRTVARHYYCKQCRQDFRTLEYWVAENDWHAMVAQDILYALGRNEIIP